MQKSIPSYSRTIIDYYRIISNSYYIYDFHHCVWAVKVRTLVQTLDFLQSTYLPDVTTKTGFQINKYLPTFFVCNILKLTLRGFPILIYVPIFIAFVFFIYCFYFLVPYIKCNVINYVSDYSLSVCRCSFTRVFNVLKLVLKVY